MKDGMLAHLLPAARKQAELGNDERILGLLRDRWIDYPRATQALQQLERLYETPRRDRMPCLLLHGDSNIGKTKITAKFRRAHPNEFDERSGVERCSVVSMQMPPTPDQHRFYSGLLFELGASHNAAAGLASLERLARDTLRRIRATSSHRARRSNRALCRAHRRPPNRRASILATWFDILLQKQRDKAAAKRFFKRVLRSSPLPSKIVTDQLCSYPAAKALIPELANVKHVFVKAAARLNNRAENSHQPTRERERRMRGFRDPKRTQAFLSSFGPIRQHFALKRHLLRASLYRKQLAA
jgi:hypothetical protein